MAELQQGKIRHIGLSNVSGEQLERARAIAPNRLGAEPIQPRRSRVRGRASPLRARTDRLHLLRAPRARPSRARRADRAPGRESRDACSDRTGSAPAMLRGDHPHSRHVFERSSRGEHGCSADSAVGRRVHRAGLLPSGVGAFESGGRPEQVRDAPSAPSAGPRRASGADSRSISGLFSVASGTPRRRAAIPGSSSTEETCRLEQSPLLDAKERGLEADPDE